MQNLRFKKHRPARIFSRLKNTVLDGVLDVCLPYEIGEVAFARCWRMTEGSLYVRGDPSVSRTKKLCSSHLPKRGGKKQ
jgi:hypothetical protein